jgi:GDP-L-fucose synthase
MRKVLITGGAGFVGRHFCRRFLEHGDRVICVDSVAEHTGGIHPNTGWPLFDPRHYERFDFHHEDCRAFFNRVKDDDFDYVLHLAAMVGGRMMIEHNPLAVADDLAIDAMYWQWAKETKPKKTLYFSSSAAYPIKFQRKDNYVLLSEDMINFESDIGMPDMTYGWAKLTGEYLSRLAYERHGLRSVVYRPFSGYGEDQDDSYPFPAICKRVLKHKGENRLAVWGSGNQMRDFIHIEDCVDGVFQTMDAIDDGDAVNLSTGVYTSFKQLLGDIAAGALGFTPEVVGMSDKPEGVFARGGCTRRQKQLGFSPKIELRDGVQRALNFFASGKS